MTVFVRALSRTPYMSSAATASTRKTAGSVERAAVAGRPGDRGGDGDPEDGVQQRLQVAAPADGDRGDRDPVLEDEVPADDPGHELAQRRVAVRVRAAGDRDRRGQLAVRERREQAGDAGEGEGDDDRRAGVADRLADDDEDARADDRADAQRGEVEHADRALEPVLGVVLRLADQHPLRLAGDRDPGARRWPSFALLGTPIGQPSPRRAVRQTASIQWSAVPEFRLDPIFTPAADQPTAIDQLAEGIEAGERFATLLGRDRHRQDDDDGGRRSSACRSPRS